MFSWIPISLMLMSMVFVLMYAWKWFGSLRVAFIVMLIVGKVWAVILSVFGFDKPLFNLIILNKLKGTQIIFTITACQAIFLSFLASLVMVVCWPYISVYLPEPIRRVELISQSSGERR